MCFEPDASQARLASVAEAATRSLSGDRIARWGQRVPEATEGIYALAVGVSGLLITREDVNRVAVVGDLCRSVHSGVRRDERPVRSTADSRLARRPHGWPLDRARADARALCACISLE